MRFTRSSNPILSVILPSRQRFDALVSTINSFLSLSNDPSQVEFLVKLDSDDIETIAKVHQLPGKTKTLISERLRGYHDLHLFVNDLCKLAVGDWVLLFNDDARMTTRNWDVALQEVDPFVCNPEFAGSDSVCLLNPGSPESDKTDVFPMVRRTSIKTLGHFSLHPHNDTWVQYTYMPLNAVISYPNIRLKHFNNDVKDATRDHSAKAQETSFADWHDFADARARDTEALRKLINSEAK
jgi:hypothetical protein